MNIVQACYITDSHCEYCSHRGKKWYVPLHKSVANPAIICEECAKEHTVVDWFDKEVDYYKALNKVKTE